MRERFPALPVVPATDCTERQPALPGVGLLAKTCPIEKLNSLLATVIADVAAREMG